MSQNSMIVANGTGAAVRTAINNALDSLVTNDSGASAPATTQAYMFWADTTTGLLKIRNAANSAWITLGTIATGQMVGTLSAGTTLTQNPYANNATVTQAHGLGAHPHMVITYLECLTAELNYSVGDRVRYESEFLCDGSPAGSTGFTITTDATNVVLVTANAAAPLVMNKTTRVQAAITPANWKLIAIPYKIN